MAYNGKGALVAGLGLGSSLGFGRRENEYALRRNQHGFRPIDCFDVSHYRAKTAGTIELPGEKFFRHLTARQERALPPATKMLAIVIDEALRDAGREDLSGIDALVLGTSAFTIPAGERYYKGTLAGTPRHKGQLRALENYYPQRQVNEIAQHYDWHGRVIIISNACASGGNAIGHAMHLIASGQAKRVLAAGVDAISEMVFAGFDSLQALSPSGIPRPFDAERDGLALGEGAAALILEHPDADGRRRDTGTRLVGYGFATDIHHLTQPHPEGRAAVRSMSQATGMAGLKPEEVGYLNAHGTGTPLNDSAEARAISTWAGEAVSHLPVSSTKSLTGHLLGGAGALEAAFCIMALQGQWLPPNINVNTVDEACRFDLVTNFRGAPIRTALSNSFGFGGSNASLLFSLD